MFFHKLWWAPPVLAFVSTGVFAQSAGKQELPPLTYESSFSSYKPYQDAKPGAWPQLNQTVGAVGGHAGSLQNATQRVTATGRITAINKAASSVQLDQEAIKSLGWPERAAHWPLKNAGLVDGVKVGDRLDFVLELSGDAYQIVSFAPATSPAPPPANSSAEQKPASPAAKPPVPNKPDASGPMRGMPPGHKM